MTAADAKRELEERAKSANEKALESTSREEWAMWRSRARAYEEAASIVGAVRS
jgi:hypothetical protein